MKRMEMEPETTKNVPIKRQDMELPFWEAENCCVRGTYIPKYHAPTTHCSAMCAWAINPTAHRERGGPFPERLFAVSDVGDGAAQA